MQEDNVDEITPSIEEGEFTPTVKYVPKTKKEIKKIAKGLYKNELFSSMQIRNEDSNLVLNIFMPLVFMSPLDRKQLMIDKIAHFYGELEGTTSAINGYPILFNCSTLTQEDADKVITEYKNIIEILEGSNGEDTI